MARLCIVAVVFDRFHRLQIYDAGGAFDGEMKEVNDSVVSTPLSASGELDEICIQLYCNTLNDQHGTPYHYEWISVEANRNEEGEGSSAEDDEDDDYNNPAPHPIFTSDDEDGPLPLPPSDDEEDTAPPSSAPDVDSDQDNYQAPLVPELPLRIQ